MTSKAGSNNFPLNAAKFLSRLKRNNNKDWFESHRDEFNNQVLLPAQEFVIVLGELLHTVAPDIMAIPKIDKSIFRLHRDVRFSKDKSPYKTNLGILFWEGERKKMECSGFYFHIEPDYIFLGAGIYMFNDELLKKYRAAIYNPDKAKELDTIIKKLGKKGYDLGGKIYKRVPKGFDNEYPYSEYLLYNGLYEFVDTISLNIFQKKDVVKFTFKIFEELLPVHQWLVRNI